jgi:uncharacterized protein YjiK
LAHPPPAPGEKAKRNKGWEGLAFLPAAVADDGKDHLVAVHEGRPKVVALFAWPGLAPERTLALPAGVDAALGDLSDVAVDAAGGVWLLSDQSRRLAQVRLSAKAATLTAVSLRDLPLQKDEKPEGVVVEAGATWIVTDGSGRLVRLPR